MVRGVVSNPVGGRLRDGSAALAVWLVAALFMLALAAHADPAFRAWIETLWPEANALGVSRATFDAAFNGLEPDLSLPDLLLPGREQRADSRGQSEFTSPPSDYLNKANLARLASDGKALAVRHKAALDKIEREIGVDRYSVLALWGRETAFGKYKLPHDAIRVLATQAYLGRRKDLFRNEILHALRMLEAGIERSDMRSSWAGAVGLTQFMPSEYFEHAYDLDGDGKTDIFRSAPDALASAAHQLRGKGWVPGQSWGYEVRIPPTSDCALEGPTQARPIAEWARLGFVRAGDRPWTQSQLGLEAYLMSPAGAYGPSFLVLENYKVIRRYNTSDLYAIFIGNLADRIAGGGDFATPWSAGAQKTQLIEEVQKRLKEHGYDIEKIDGKIGSNTRQIIGRYQRTNKLKVDCWPSEQLVAHLQSAGGR